MCPWRRILRVIYGINEFVSHKTVEFGIDVGLESQHVRSSKLPAGSEHAINPVGAPRSLPLHADRIRITIRRDAPVCSGDNSGRRIQHTWQLVKRKVAGPLVRVVAATHWEAAISRGANRNFAGRLVSNVAIDVRINDALAGRVK